MPRNKQTKIHDPRTCDNSKPCFDCEYPTAICDLCNDELATNIDDWRVFTTDNGKTKTVCAVCLDHLAD